MVPGRLAQAAYAAALTCLAALIAWLAAATFPAVAGARAPRAAILPPQNPHYSLGVGRYIPSSCGGVRDFSPSCLNQSLGMINAGRRSESLGPLVLPRNWELLTVSQQLFVLTELERTARGLPADVGLSSALNGVAVGGADAGRDPSGGSGGLESLWAGGEPNPIVVLADWVYEDGMFADGFTENLNCSASRTSGCWQHRDTLLHDSASSSCGRRCAVGAGYSASGYSAGAAAASGRDSYAEVFASSASGGVTFTWAAELAQLPSCERGDDSCTWRGNPVATTSGIETMGVSRHAPAGTRPWFSLRITHRLRPGGRFSLRIHPGIRLFRVNVVARRGSRHITLRVRRLSRYRFMATGRLPAGAWTVRIRYRTTRTSRRRPSSQLRVTVR